MAGTVPFDIHSLTIDERLDLITELWESIRQSGEEIPLTDAQVAEIERRLDDYERGPDAGEPWEVVRERLGRARPSLATAGSKLAVSLGLADLPTAERADAVEQIVDSIRCEEGEFGLSAAQIAELDRRLEEHRRHPETAISWEEVKAELEERWGA